MSTTEPVSGSRKVATGIPGLDDVLGGGLPKARLYLIQGAPGSGKTTLALQFLLTGARAGAKVLYISLSETRDEVEEVAHSHGWPPEGVEIVEFSALEQQLFEAKIQTGGAREKDRQTLVRKSDSRPGVDPAELSVAPHA